MSYVLPLEENATDSLVHAVEHLQEYVDTGELRHVKYVILHTYHAVELFLKATIVRHDPEMIYVGPASTNPFRKTVGMDEAVKRLKRCGVDVSERKAYLTSLKHVRNPIEHHELIANKEELIDHVGRAISFLDVFTETELGIAIRDELDDRLTGNHYRTVLDHLYSYGERVEAVMRHVSQYDIDYNKKMYYEHLACPACGEQAVVYPDPQSHDGTLHCFFCEKRFIQRNCSRCGSPVLDNDSPLFEETDICEDCWDQMLNDEE